MLGKVKKGKKMSAICFNNVLKTKPKEQLENAATKAKDELAKAQKVLDEYKNKDLSDEKRQLNDKLARLDELNLYVGRVDKNSPNDATIARLEARYGKEYHEIVDIVREKIDKENADEVLDISFAPKRSDESALSEKAQNLGIMSAENLEKGEKMSNEPLNISVDLSQKSLFKDLRDKAFKIMIKLRKESFKNESNGVVASISRDGIDKILSPKAVNKTLKNGHKKELHFAIAEKVGDLFKKAEFSHSEAPRNQSQDIVAYHKYNAHFKINGKDAKAKITLKESFEAGHKIYLLELLEIE